MECQVGRAYFEMVDYSEAERAYSWAQRVAPHYLEGTDMYSTALYVRDLVYCSLQRTDMCWMDHLCPS